MAPPVQPLLLPLLLGRLARSWAALLQALGQPPALAPALAVHAPVALPHNESHDDGETNSPSFLDSIFWMAAPKKRRTIEVNRCRRRNPNKLEKVKNNIEVCQECGHLKLKHVLCSFCYQKVQRETSLIRAQIQAQEGRPHNAPAVETVVLYEGEKMTDTENQRVIERNRKRPLWFTQY
ncbi:39S ribosomal protein L32, mitochondrial [Callorhinchus milii]|uniref:39S ribosomal protein L32, mitochondrial n=1 Tax=Callorhinchus milii TaxID=7868 RepID=UPI001C3FA48D|nr:39S ribosomal protein L32, mitochondrial [Callorhinchus milii]